MVNGEEGKWGDFCPEYKTAGNLRHLIVRTTLNPLGDSSCGLYKKCEGVIVSLMHLMGEVNNRLVG